jgi:hypothetical protein
MSTQTILCRQQAATHNDLEYSLTPDAAVILMADGSARILDMADRFYAVPPVATLMLQQTLQHGLASAVQRVAAEYDVARSQAEDDLRRFLATLEKRGILRRNRGGGGRGSDGLPKKCLAAGMLNLTLGWMPSLKAQAAALLTAAKLCLGSLGWTRTVAAWRRQFPIRPVCLSPHQAETRARAIDDAVCSAAAWNPFGVACKERALSCWVLARTAGLPAALVIGVELFPLSGHCWCEAGPWIVSDHAENCVSYVPALRYQ